VPRRDSVLRVRVRLYGVLKTAAKMEEVELDLESATSVAKLVSKLVDTIARKEFEEYLIDADLRDPRPNALIMVSGTEIGALNGLDTVLKEGDEVVLLPVAHGGAKCCD
jgi:molybdopterin converting factor small subunit